MTHKEFAIIGFGGKKSYFHGVAVSGIKSKDTVKKRQNF